jgi:hypothetical protein
LIDVGVNAIGTQTIRERTHPVMVLGRVQAFCVFAPSALMSRKSAQNSIIIEVGT